MKNQYKKIVKVVSILVVASIVFSCNFNSTPNLGNDNFKLNGSVNNTNNPNSLYNFNGMLNRTDGDPVPVPTPPPAIGSLTLPAYTVNYFTGAPILGNADGNMDSARFVSPSNMAIDSKENIYVVDRNPFFYFTQLTDGLIRKIDKSGNVTTITVNSVDGVPSAPNTKFKGAIGITLDSSDNIYVSQADRISKISPTLGAFDVTTLYIDPLFNSQASYERSDHEGIVIDNNKNIYVSDTAHSVIRKLAYPYTTMNIVVGALDQAYPQNGIGTKARIPNPWGMVYDGTNIFVSERVGGRIQKIDPNLNVTSFAGTGTNYKDFYATIDGSVSIAQMLLICGLSFDKDKNIIVGDTDRIRAIDPNGNTKSPILDFEVYGNFRPSIYYPQGIISDSAGNIYISDTGNSRILKLVPSTTNMDLPKDNIKYNVSTIVGNDNKSLFDSQGINASFLRPTALAIDTTGNIYVSDYGNIRKVDTNLNVSTISSLSSILYPNYYSYGVSLSTTASPYNIFANQDGSITIINGYKLFDMSSSGAINTTSVPAGSNYIDLIRDSSGNTYCIDGNAIRKNGVIFAGSNLSGFNDGNGTSARFYLPNKLALDSIGNIYVADTGSNAIRKIDTSGNVTTIAGKSNKSGYRDGNGTNAKFRSPTSLVVDSLGYIYVTDMDNNCIRKISPSGDVWTIAGNTSFQYADGLGTNAIFNKPSGIAIDSVGNIYVADSFNRRIRKLTKQ